MQRKNKMQGPIIVFCFVILPVLFLFLFFQRLEQGREINNQYYAKKLKVRIESGGSEEYVHAWKSEVDNQYYLFLPAYAKMENTTVALDETDETSIYIEDRLWTKEEGITNMEKEIPYSIEFRNSSLDLLEKSSLILYQSEYLAAVHIATNTGDMNYVQGSKESKEEGWITLITAEGEVNYEGQLTYLKGRGNATWEYPKKPYNLKLKQKENLLNLGIGDTWSLLANWADHSFIRNKIAYDLGKGVGLESTTDAEFVDLYLNGEYNGTYQLTEKIEVNKDHSNDYLLEMEILERWKDEPKGFLTEAGQAITIKSPGTISYDEVDALAEKFQELENAILSENGVNPETGRTITQLMDLPSWVKVYLIQEVMQNYDAYVSSLFMYTEDAQESPIYCGPIWDFDWALIARDGTAANVLTANQSRHPYTNYWMPSLYEQAFFYQALVKEYKEVFLPVLEEIREQKIPLYTEQLTPSIQMNAKRWNKQTLEQWNESVAEVSAYLTRRTNSLLEIWETPEQFYKVGMECNSDSFGRMDYYVKPGETCDNFPEGLKKEGFQFLGWYLKGTEEPFDLDTPVYDHLDVEAKWLALEDVSPLSKLKNAEILQIRYILSGILIGGLLGLIICDLRNNKKKRGEQKHE